MGSHGVFITIKDTTFCDDIHPNGDITQDDGF